MGMTGVGVLIGRLYDDGSGAAVAGAVGKAIRSAMLADDVLQIALDGGEVLTLHDAGQSCCESRYMRTDDDLSKMVGATLTGVELRDAPDMPGEEAHEVQFLDVRTSAGVFTFSNHNEHNGYYGGFDLSARLARPSPDTEKGGET